MSQTSPLLLYALRHIETILNHYWEEASAEFMQSEFPKNHPFPALVFLRDFLEYYEEHRKEWEALPEIEPFATLTRS